MPRKWDNSTSGGGGSVKHRFVEDTPVVRAFDLNVMRGILLKNEQAAKRETRAAGKRPQR